MELRDFLVTPIFLLLLYGVAYVIRPHVTDPVTRQYFLPGLTVKLFGGIALGVIYQYYYGSGDTFMFHTYGSRIVWNAFVESPAVGMKLIFGKANAMEGVFQYASQIYHFRDFSSYMIIRMAALFDLLTFSTYSSTAALFAVLSFIGSWQFFLTFYKQFPTLHRPLAIASLFIPSVIFWGSGILKDSVMLACVGIATHQFYQIFQERRYRVRNFVLLLGALMMIFYVKKFILQAYLPAVILWIGSLNVVYIRSFLLKAMLVPFVLLILATSAYFTVVKVGEDDERYAVSKLATTARTTAYDIRYWSGREAGSGYSLGELDGTYSTMLSLAPSAINVSLFRPYLWEVNNPLMLLSALESLVLLIFSVYIVVVGWSRLPSALVDPNILFCLAFSLTFAFAVGISTFNFGTLARYKVPLLPFFLTALILILNHRNKDRKVDALD